MKVTKQVKKLEDKVAVLEKEKEPKKLEVKSTSESTPIPINAKATKDAPGNDPVFPKVDGNPHCVVTSTFNLEGTDPVSFVMTQNKAQMEIRQYIIDFCRRNKIVGMNINFEERKIT